MRALLMIGFIATLAGGCSDRSAGDVATLYRHPIVGDPNERMHVATFDAPYGQGYNSTNCTTFADLVMAQEGVSVRYWCEAGAFRP